MDIQNKSDVTLGKFLSLILRHKPETIKISLDENGWADVEELIQGMQKSGKKISKEILERIVRENEKKRYCFNSDHTKIRANQGHSIAVDVELKRTAPPALLYHGTASCFLETIKQQGIKKQKRQYVHLSIDEKTALIVGKRHGTPVILAIDTAKMEEDGFEFYLSENNVWLCGDIPSKYIRKVI